MSFHKLRLCHIETEKNFIFCYHSSEKSGLQIKLVITDDKSDDGEQETININYCPFCGHTEKPEGYTEE